PAGPPGDLEHCPLIEAGPAVTVGVPHSDQTLRDEVFDRLCRQLAKLLGVRGALFEHRNQVDRPSDQLLSSPRLLAGEGWGEGGTPPAHGQAPLMAGALKR